MYFLFLRKYHIEEKHVIVVPTRTDIVIWWKIECQSQSDDNGTLYCLSLGAKQIIPSHSQPRHWETLLFYWSFSSIGYEPRPWRLTHSLPRQGNLDQGIQGNLAPVVEVGLHGPHGVEQGSLHLRLPSQHQKMHLL